MQVPFKGYMWPCRALYALHETISGPFRGYMWLCRALFKRYTSLCRALLRATQGPRKSMVGFKAFNMFFKEVYRCLLFGVLSLRLRPKTFPTSQNILPSLPNTSSQAPVKTSRKLAQTSSSVRNWTSYWLVELRTLYRFVDVSGAWTNSGCMCEAIRRTMLGPNKEETANQNYLTSTTDMYLTKSYKYLSWCCVLM